MTNAEAGGPSSQRATTCGAELAVPPKLVKEITAKTRASTLGLLLAASISCGQAASGVGAPPAHVGEGDVVDPHALTVAALDCFMRPVVYDPPPWEKAGEQTRTLRGAEASSCVTAAQAIRVRPWRLYRHSPDAVFDLRHAVTRQASARPSSESKALIALFDLGTATALEGRRIHAALIGEANAPSRADVIRERDTLLKLDEFGRNTEGPIGAEARAVAMLIPASDFLQVGRLPAELRPLAAAPLMAVVFGPELAPDLPEERTPAWGEYIVAAARAVPRLERARVAASEPGRVAGNRAAIGGGPVVESEHENLRSVVQAVVRELSAVAVNMPPSPLSAAVDRSLYQLTTLDLASAVDDGGPPEREH